MIATKRVYEKAAKDDGFRVLVDRLWPRGLTKEKARVDLWMKEIAPSDALRKWYGHEPEKWAEFVKRYKAEWKEKKALFDEIQSLEKKHGKVTLVYGRNDPVQNQAVLLLSALKGKA